MGQKEVVWQTRLRILKTKEFSEKEVIFFLTWEKQETKNLEHRYTNVF